MKLIFLILLALSLTACQTTRAVTPIPVQVPSLPVEFVKADRLPPIESLEMGERELAGAESDRTYNSVAFRYNVLLDIYECVRVTINSKKDPKECLE